MKVLFLDFDGVLNTAYNCSRMAISKEPANDDYGIMFDPDCVRNLQCIIKETGAQIVISSSWKTSYSYRDFLRMWEIRHLPGFVTDVTPTISRHRGDDIAAWIRECRDVSAYAIIDDLDYRNFNQDQYSHLVTVDGYHGLDKNAMEKAITILNDNDAKEPVLCSRKVLTSDNGRLLILPDIHGRTFWKRAVEQYQELPVIFLGDYLDPYQNHIEVINPSEAYLNFLEILEFKEKNPERVTMLLGNHDVHYFSKAIIGDRKDFDHEDDIRRLFEEHLDWFKLADLRTVEGQRYLFSHAGIVKSWLKKHFDPHLLLDIPAMCDALNSRVKDVDPLTEFLENGLYECSSHRGGYHDVGSIVWADMREHFDGGGYFYEITQVFGHTQQEKVPYICETFANLDCRKATVLTDQGSFIQV